MEEDLNLFQIFKAAIKLVTGSVLDENVQQLSNDLEHWLNAITPVMIRVVRKFPLSFFQQMLCPYLLHSVLIDY